MKGRITLLAKCALVVAVFAQTSNADTGFTLMAGASWSDPLYMTLCGLCLLFLGAKSGRRI
jgi:hypothetical protein